MTNEFKTTLYTKTVCSQCDSTKAVLNELGVEYEVINMETTPGVLEQLKALGFRAAPVVVTEKGAWGGHNEEKIRAVFA